MTLIEQLFDGLSDEQIRRISRKSGVIQATLKSWQRNRRTARLDLFTAAANAAGFDVVLQPKELDMAIPRRAAQRTPPKGAPRLVSNGKSRMEVYIGNHMIGYVEDDLLFGIDGKGYASEVGFVGHRVEIVPKLTAWRTAQGITS